MGLRRPTHPSETSRRTSTQGMTSGARRGSLMRFTTKSPTCSSLRRSGWHRRDRRPERHVVKASKRTREVEREDPCAPKATLGARGDWGGGLTNLFLRGIEPRRRGGGPSLESPGPVNALEPWERTSPGGVVRGPRMSTWSEGADREGWGRRRHRNRRRTRRRDGLLGLAAAA